MVDVVAGDTRVVIGTRLVDVVTLELTRLVIVVRRT